MHPVPHTLECLTETLIPLLGKSPETAQGFLGTRAWGNWQEFPVLDPKEKTFSSSDSQC